jgi:hypothetical protein
MKIPAKIIKVINIQNPHTLRHVPDTSDPGTQTGNRNQHLIFAMTFKAFTL